MNKLPRGIRMKGDKYAVNASRNGRRLWATCDSVEEAIKVQGEMKEALAKGFDWPPADSPHATPTRKTKDDRPLSDSWSLVVAKDKTVEACWEGTPGLTAALKNINFALKFFGGDRLIHTISTEDIDAYIAWLKKRGNSNATINRKLSALSKVMTCAIDRGKMDNKPKLPRLKESKGRIRFLSYDEEKRVLGLMKQLGKEDHYEATIVLIDTGMRLGELLRLQGIDVHWNTNRIAIWQNKTEHPRSIPMVERIRPIIAKRIEEYGEGKLFPFDHGWYRNTWDRVRGLMNLEDDPQFVPHVLRHTCCSRLVQGGTPLPHVQVWMGHTCIQTTMRYGHLAPSDLDSCARVLESPNNRWGEAST